MGFEFSNIFWYSVRDGSLKILLLHHLPSFRNNFGKNMLVLTEVLAWGFFKGQYFG